MNMFSELWLCHSAQEWATVYAIFLQGHIFCTATQCTKIRYAKSLALLIVIPFVYAKVTKARLWTCWMKMLIYFDWPDKPSLPNPRDTLSDRVPKMAIWHQQMLRWGRQCKRLRRLNLEDLAMLRKQAYISQKQHTYWSYWLDFLMHGSTLPISQDSLLLCRIWCGSLQSYNSQSIYFSHSSFIIPVSYIIVEGL